VIDRLYFDASYLVRLYLDDAGAERVRKLARGSEIVCSLHGRTETIAAFHRAYREGRFSRKAFLILLDQFRWDEEDKGAFGWIWPDNEASVRAEKAYREASSQIFLRAADAMHLACAAENGLHEIYSNDRHLLAAASLFGLAPKNVIH
jgi:predicted nucleic acid-binding protein